MKNQQEKIDLNDPQKNLFFLLRAMTLAVYMYIRNSYLTMLFMVAPSIAFQTDVIVML